MPFDQKSQHSLRKYALLLISPEIFLLLIWLSQYFVHNLFDTGIYAPSIFTWLIVFTALISFTSGSLLTRLSIRIRPNPTDVTTRNEYPALILISLSLPLAFLAAATLTYRIGESDLGLFSSLKMNFLEESATGSKSSIFLVYIILFNTLSVIYYCNVVNFLQKRSSFFVIFITGILCLFSGSRALLMFFIVSLLPTYIFHKKRITVKNAISIISVPASALLFFFTYPIFFQGIGMDSTGYEILQNYFSVYLFSGISAFSQFVEVNEPSYQCLLLIPRPFHGFVDTFFLTSFSDTCPVIPETIDVPLATNVYSVFYLAMHDLGLIGIVSYFLVLGMFTKYAYIRGFRLNSPNWRFIYCILFFSIFMSFFDDQFARGFIYYFFAIIVLTLSIALKISTQRKIT